ncbi:MAG: DUF433 domain-containing protein [Candidatus Competibacteraceae bacterium]
METNRHPRIERKPGVRSGKPCVAGTAITVQNIVIWTEQGHTPDDIVNGYPHLSLSDVHAALGYYYDHLEEIDRDIMESAQFVADMEAAQQVQNENCLNTDAPIIPS